MDLVIEDERLRDKTRVFDDRAQAGKLLAERLSDYKASDAIILAIPAGGVPVAFEIANALGLMMDIIVVRKIQIPDNPEAGFGAVGPEGDVIFNERLLSRLNLSQKEIELQIEKTKRVLEERNLKYRGKRPFPDLKNRVVILVDDGLASGYTMYEAVRFIKRKEPEKIIIAVPTAPRHTIDMLLPNVDEIYCLNIRSSYYFAVADAYKLWYDVDDKEVISLLNNINQE
jgi:predicted phosphoribosyltransferase